MCNIALTNLRCENCHYWTGTIPEYGECQEFLSIIQEGTLVDILIDVSVLNTGDCFDFEKVETHKDFGCKLFRQREES